MLCDVVRRDEGCAAMRRGKMRRGAVVCDAHVVGCDVRMLLVSASPGTSRRKTHEVELFGLSRKSIAMNLQSGPRNGRSCSRAPATYITCRVPPRSSSCGLSSASKLLPSTSRNTLLVSKDIPSDQRVVEHQHVWRTSHRLRHMKTGSRVQMEFSNVRRSLRNLGK